MTQRIHSRVRWLAALLLLASCAAPAADWPMWRYDARRGAASPHALPDRLHLQWVRHYPKLDTAWPDQARMRFDKAYSPVAMGNRLFVPSSRTDSITALDTVTGRELWTFHADGPIRFAPVAWNGKLYVGAEDGLLYCLDVTDGAVRWTVRAAPSGRKVLGNYRLISTWPVRGAPTLLDGKLYFAAGVWPFMGIFITCLDAETGEVVWKNDHCGSMYTLRPHHSAAFSGLAPQGYLAAVGDDLLVPNGRTTVARMHRKTGKLIYHHATGSGTYHLAATDRFFFNAGRIHQTETGRGLNLRSGYGVALTDRTAYTTGVYSIRAYDIAGAEVKEREDRRGRAYYVVDTDKLWQATLPFFVSALIQAGPRLYAGGQDTLVAVDLPKPGDEPKQAWTLPVEGRTVELLAANDRLFAVTLDGKIYCFGAKKVTPTVHKYQPAQPVVNDQVGAVARGALDASGVKDGYCVVLGIETARLAEELARQSELHVIAIDPDGRKVDAARKRLHALGLYGHRVVVLKGDPATYPLPPYLARLVVSERPAALLAADAGLIRQAFRVLRPYGGALCLRGTAAEQKAFAAKVRALRLPGAKATVRPDGRVTLVRQGPLSGSADWTHEYADASNTAVSQDALVRAPLGVLWFGGPSNREILPRHGHGPSPQVVGGRLIIEGPDVLRAVDVYTGRLLWEAPIPGIGTVYDNTNHQPGANALGSNYVTTRDTVYVHYGTHCLLLDPATGRKKGEFKLPRAADSKKDSRFGFVSIHKRFLIAGADPLHMSDVFEESSTGREMIGWKLDGTSSDRLVVMDRYSGKVLWQLTARHGFIHNAIAAGGNKVFCIDRPRVPRGVLPETERGEKRVIPGTKLLAIDLATGETAWSSDKEVFGTWLGYSAEHDVLLEAGRASRDMLWDEAASRMVVRRGRTGRIMWDKPHSYGGPCMLHGKTIITQRKAYDLLTGERKLRKHPLTGQDVPWSYSRNYGCGTARASRHLLTFRSAAAGFLDLGGSGGTASLGGFKSGCTANLIPANGVLNAPDYTRTCTCGYPNQTSLALVHMPGLEVWSFHKDLPWDGTPIRRLGVNLGAPGDHRAKDGTLWLEYPYAGGPTPEIPITMQPALDPEANPAAAPGRFVRHSSRVKGEGPAWVAASGMKGLRRLTIPLALPTIKVEVPDDEPIFKPRPLTERTYTVRLHFCEPDPIGIGRRVFNVKLQGREVLKDFDIVKRAGGADRTAVVELRGIKVKETLTLEMTPLPSSKLAEPVISGVEIRAEGW